MANQNNNQNQKTTENQAVEQQNVQNVQTQAEAPQAQGNATTNEQKGGFGSWCKRHWKGLVAGGTGIGAAVTSAVFAYKKGKQAGMMAVPPQTIDSEDYSLNPNE